MGIKLFDWEEARKKAFNPGKGLRERLVKALELLDSMEEKREAIAGDKEIVKTCVAIHQELYEIGYRIPDVEVWCVMKHYKDHNQETNSWNPTVWCGFLTKKQADAFAPEIEEYYIQKSKCDYGNRFKVERNCCSAKEVISPKTTVKQYLNSLD